MRVMTRLALTMAGYDFTQYTSYTWDQPDERPTGDPRLDNNPFFVHRRHSAIHWELSIRGIQQGAAGPALAGPALAVHHHTSVRDRVEVYEADRRAGYGFESFPISPGGFATTEER